LHGCPLPGEYTLGTWTPCIAGLYALADTLDVTLFDLQDRFGGYTIEAANGLTGDAVAHLTRQAYADWGRSTALAAAR